MKQITLGSTGIVTPQNAFGCLPIQRVDQATAVDLLRSAFNGGMRFFDTARSYSDSEEKVGVAFAGMRDDVTITTKSMAKTPDDLAADLEMSLRMLQTDHINVYQFHCCDQVWRPDDGTGMYEAMEAFKTQGKILHIGLTTHKIGVAEKAIASGLYETLQYPLSYLSSEREQRLPGLCAKADMGFIAMKGLAGGLLSNTRACIAFMSQFDNVVPIWGIQRASELDEWLSYMDDAPVYDEEIAAFIESERAELSGNFCRGCGYCAPCPQGIDIHSCARMSLMLRRAPSAAWLDDYWQSEMDKIDNCIGCGTCKTRCPYELDIPQLLKANLPITAAFLPVKRRYRHPDRIVPMKPTPLRIHPWALVC